MEGKTMDLNDFAGDIIYDALIHAIKSNFGIGFHNHDQGHPAYCMGAKDGRVDFHTWGDAPEQNRLFQMVCELSKQYGSNAGLEVPSWEQFCELAYNAYLERTQKQSG
jgi:hypothetical protein